MDLYVWPGKWGLTSFDPDCLSVLTYIRFAHVPMNIHSQTYPWKSPSGQLPFLQHGQNEVTSLDGIFSYLRKENYGIEYELSDSDVISMKALLSYIDLHLVPGMDHLMWVNAESYTKVIRASYASAIGLPFSFTWPPRNRNRVEQRVTHANLFNKERVNEVQLQKWLYDQSKKCLTTLAHLLGDKEFFINDSPTAVDAVVFGRLWTLLNSPLPKNVITTHLEQCTNLTQFCTRIYDRYFSDAVKGGPAGDIRYTGPTTTSQKYSESTILDHPIRNTLLFLVISGVLSMTFMIMTGIVQAKLVFDDDDLPKPVSKPRVKDAKS